MYWSIWKMFAQQCWTLPKFYLAYLLFGGPGFIALYNGLWDWWWAVAWIMGTPLFIISAVAGITYSEQGASDGSGAD